MSVVIRSLSTTIAKKRTSESIRNSFVDYFVQKNGHVVVPSSAVANPHDRSSPFVNAGMNQFKSVFLNEQSFDIRRAVNYQKCIRISGKHCDLDAVGLDACHHTFFEMLGTWSFNDYFKFEACRLALDYLLNECKLSKECLYVTYFGGDTKLNMAADLECRDIWLRLGLRNDRIVPFGMSENFWEMGENGPCGPSTEIHLDLSGGALNRSNQLNCGCGDLIELWNLVFITCNRVSSSQIVPLHRHFVDTGMGFERLVAVLQHKSSTYDTDVFEHLFRIIETNKTKSVRSYEGKFDSVIDMWYRILVDHSRMITVALADGVEPAENPKLRRILRKTFSTALNFSNEPHHLLLQLCGSNIEYFRRPYPELTTSSDTIEHFVRLEYDLYRKFHEQIQKQWHKQSQIYPELQQFDIHDYPGYLYAFLELKKDRHLTEIGPELAFKFYDSYGLTKFAIRNLADKLNLNFNLDDFQAVLNQRRTQTKLKNLTV